MTVVDRLPEKEKRVWTTLITNTKYLRGLLTLEYSLRRAGSKYPLVALYTDTFEAEGHKILDERGIYKKRIEYLLPKAHKDYTEDARFYDCWSKLQPFSLIEFDRVVQLDSDMVVVRNMDELMELPLDRKLAVFAASHACVCNPYNKSHYPVDWHKGNCAYTKYTPIDSSRISGPFTQEHDHIFGPASTTGLSICNGGLQVVDPHPDTYSKILDALENSNQTDRYEFADQSLLSDVFEGAWVPLSYKYNALKTIRTIHDIWDDDEVKNIHYIINPKPWDVVDDEDRDQADNTDTFRYWFEIDAERLEDDRKRGIGL